MTAVADINIDIEEDDDIDARGPLPPRVQRDRAEIARRIAIVSAEKARRAALGLPLILHDAELAMLFAEPEGPRRRRTCRLNADLVGALVAEAGDAGLTTRDLADRLAEIGKTITPEQAQMALLSLWRKGLASRSREYRTVPNHHATGAYKLMQTRPWVYRALPMDHA